MQATATSPHDLLSEILSTLENETRLIREGHFEYLGELTARRTELHSRMAELDWSTENDPSIQSLQERIRDAEYQLQAVVKDKMNLIRTQIDEIKHRNLRWKASLKPHLAYARNAAFASKRS